MSVLIAAVSFLTRLPVGSRREISAREVARSARWFPVVGLLLGGIYAAVLWVCVPVFPALITAILLAGVDAGITGAMHLDGLADTIDGFGGGRTREDVLRIMRDHAIGTYGAVALVLVLILKIAAVTTLIDAHRAMAAVVLTPVLGRWSAVLMGATQTYARPPEDGSRSAGSPARFMGRTELIVATASTAAIIAAMIIARLDQWRSAIACAPVAIISAWWAWRCKRRIGGVTGDTLGAGIEISECLVLLLYTALR